MRFKRWFILYSIICPYRASVYLRSRRVQAGMIVRAIVIPALVALSMFWVVPDVTDPKSLSPLELSGLLLFYMATTITGTSLVLSLPLWLFGKVIDIPYMDFRKTLAMIGWALLISYLVIIPLLSLLYPLSLYLSLPEWPLNLLPSIYVATLLSMALRRAARAHPENVLTFWVATLLVLGLRHLFLAG